MERICKFFPVREDLFSEVDRTIFKRVTTPESVSIPLTGTL